MEDKFLPVITIAVLIGVGLLTIVLIGASGSDNQPALTAQLKIETLKEGDGPTAKQGDTLVVHYVGTLENGEKFDSSRDRGEPFEFVLGAGQVIRGWDIGLEGMRVGDIRKLTIPPALAYGTNIGNSGQAHPLAGKTLIFEVELLDIK